MCEIPSEITSFVYMENTDCTTRVEEPENYARRLLDQ